MNNFETTYLVDLLNVIRFLGGDQCGALVRDGGDLAKITSACEVRYIGHDLYVLNRCPAG